MIPNKNYPKPRFFSPDMLFPRNESLGSRDDHVCPVRAWCLWHFASVRLCNKHHQLWSHRLNLLWGYLICIHVSLSPLYICDKYFSSWLMSSLPGQGCDREGGTRGLVQSFEPEFPISFLINHLVREEFHNLVFNLRLSCKKSFLILSFIDVQEKRFQFTEHYRG